MAESVGSLLDDTRIINALLDKYGVAFAMVGTHFDRIQAYREAGEMSYVTWFAIWKNGQIIFRQNGKYVARVIYRTEATHDD